MVQFDSPVRKLLPILDEGFYWDDDGKLQRRPTGPMAETPWIYQNMTFQCVLWHRLFFDLLSGQSMVHSHCHECYKVVIAPRTVEELISLEEWQAQSGLECKCGIEIRDFVNRKRLYGGYFYNRGVEPGRRIYNKVKAFAGLSFQNYETFSSKLRFSGLYSEPMPVILKRGCSEFERALGDSAKWGATPEQQELEDWMLEHVGYDPFGQFKQPEVLKQSIRIAWLKWAHHNGDKTYLKFMPDNQPFDEQPMYASEPYRTYHDDVEI